MNARAALSRERIVAAAAAVADRGGIAAVSMRSVASELGVEAMSLYHHVASKGALLDALADWAFEQILAPEVDDPWRPAMAARARSARSVLVQHPWALGMIEARPRPGTPLLRHFDRVLGCLRNAGFPAALATHLFSALDAYIYGFALTESTLPFTPADGAENAFAEDVAPDPEEYPHLTWMLGELMRNRTYSFADEFDVGLDVILDGFEQRLAQAT
ncbi:TetR/AcrR family transcriptional regulator [Microbacterium hydrocarbonoxydans]|uniref:TetR/AcrR family transcriptional regulator n=1 Tax=Microbacterium hydrocarbonoxydans TaxID=273678 RepID=UPI0007BBC32A|nr:TetR/AcrR family transcriptional regulator [Microbacterium hydrocarbonoxydans]GAT74530.1 putative TetR family transcriptional regulator [Microbacterium sp. HM58-2]